MSEEVIKVEARESSVGMTKEKRNELLIKWGYYKKEYSDKGYKTDEYPFSESNGEAVLYYKKVPRDVSNEEFNRIAQEEIDKIAQEVDRIAQKEKENHKKEAEIKNEAYMKKVALNENVIAVIFTVLGFLTFLVGFILGIVLGKDRWGDFSFPLALAYWAGGFISGMFMLAVAEIISLLQRIANNIKWIANNI